MATTEVTQTPKTYTVSHKIDGGDGLYKPFRFKFVPIPNSDASSDEVLSVLNNNSDYSHTLKEFYSMFNTKGETQLTSKIGSDVILPVVYAKLNGSNKAIIYAVDNDGTPEYKCIQSGTSNVSIGNANLANRGLNDVGINDVNVYIQDGDEQKKLSVLTTSSNAFADLNDTGYISFTIPTELTLKNVEIKSGSFYINEFYRNVGSTKESLGQSTYLCRYGSSGEQSCIYSSNLQPASVASMDTSMNSTIRLDGHEYKAYTSEYKRTFLKINDTILGSSFDFTDWDLESEVNSEYKVYQEDDSTFYIGKVNSNGNTTWYTKYTLGVSYGNDGSINVTMYCSEPLDAVDASNINNSWNNTYVKRATYKKQIYIEDINDTSKNDKFKSCNNAGFINNSLPNSSELSLIIINALNGNLDKYKSLDTNNSFVIDTADNKVILGSSVNVGKLNLRLTTQEPGAGA